MWNPDQVSEYMTRASVNPLARIVFIEHKIDGCVMFRMNVAEFAQFDARVEGIAESIQEAIDRLRPLDGLGAYTTCALCTSVPLPLTPRHAGDPTIPAQVSQPKPGDSRFSTIPLNPETTLVSSKTTLAQLSST